MEFVDVILIMMYLAMTTALVTVVWSKTRIWWKTLIGAGLCCTAVSLVIWLLPDVLDSSNDALWNTVADTFIGLITLMLLLIFSILIWSMARRR